MIQSVSPVGEISDPLTTVIDCCSSWSLSQQEVMLSCGVFGMYVVCAVTVKSCKLPGCLRTCAVDDHARTFDYCSNKHSKMHSQMTNFCGM